MTPTRLITPVSRNRNPKTSPRFALPTHDNRSCHRSHPLSLGLSDPTYPRPPSREIQPNVTNTALPLRESVVLHTLHTLRLGRIKVVAPAIHGPQHLAGATARALLRVAGPLAAGHEDGVRGVVHGYVGEGVGVVAEVEAAGTNRERNGRLVESFLFRL